MPASALGVSEGEAPGPLLPHPVPHVGTIWVLGSRPAFSVRRLGRLMGLGAATGAMVLTPLTRPRVCRPGRGGPAVGFGGKLVIDDVLDPAGQLRHGACYE